MMTSLSTCRILYITDYPIDSRQAFWKNNQKRLNHLRMNPLDILIIIILAYGLIRGIFRGMIKEISSIIGVLAGFYAAYSYYPLLAKTLDHWITSVVVLNIISFTFIFCFVFFIISLIGVVIKYLMNLASMGWFDRILGLAFGCIKGILIVSVILVALTAFLPKGAPIIKTSFLAPHVTMISEKMAIVISKEMKQSYTAKIKEFKKSWNIPN
jgi:membrane protein required for colicin V production